MQNRIFLPLTALLLVLLAALPAGEGRNLQFGFCRGSNCELSREDENEDMFQDSHHAPRDAGFVVPSR